MQSHADQCRLTRRKIGLVATMGGLHTGHLTLVDLAAQHCNDVVVSIFVNPTQFGPDEDYNNYPRSFEKDLELCRHHGARVVFAPSRDDLYGHGYQSHVSVEKLSQHLCGLSRPVFFKGVTTVVAKLFNIVKPHLAVFGQKDMQQLLVIRQMVRDLNYDIDIMDAPIARESDGLAMSSRNQYLSNDQRQQACALYRVLKTCEKLFQDGENNAGRLISAAQAIIKARTKGLIDYVSVCDPVTLDRIETAVDGTLIAVAVQIGTTRLIDNLILKNKP